ncbi:MAG: hypothetical protein NVS9B10_02410 [Nevskia sp.]
MSAPQASHGQEAFPRKPLFGALALVGLALLTVGAARLSRIGTPIAASTLTNIAAERDLRFEDRDDGSIAVFDDRSGALVDTLAPGSNNFLRGTLRGLVRERRQDSIAGIAAFRLILNRDGHLLLSDPATARTIDLGSFGPTNAQAFSRLLTTKAGAMPTQTASVLTPSR